MSYLLDTGFAVAFLNRQDARHSDVVRSRQQIQGTIHFPVPAITETSYLLARDVGTDLAAAFIASLSRTDLILEDPLPEDYQRAATLMLQYADAQIDFVDALIVAIAERRDISRILTLDQRDFRLIRPRHCDAFELLP
ncbi:MAG: PIN domain-containing protein [Blastocatellia bacterium]|nr:PIN domain-containing protein [Blastocatellia bacterium]